ncbi:MAG: four helix bundle protein [Armatimonadetes bacterium]|nr:four helix bundle protein [Armatimonadota bacterium]MBS1700357.1 four helix bundle protein [Armatimonadota bacterium]MBS1727798.1 four helix bundle protein [Armatimonadota bacterium]
MTFRDLIAWQKGMDLVVAVYAYTDKLPKSQGYVLVAQMQRASLSIPSNISEGYGRGSKIEFARFVDIALGSTREIQTQLEVCERLGYPSPKAERELAEEVGRIIYALAKSLRKK